MDVISNMIIALKNAGFAGRDSAAVPYSKLKEDILKVLKAEGFVKDYAKKTQQGRPVLVVSLFLLENRAPKVQGVKRLSKPSKRVYKKYSEMRPVRQGYGAMIVSTPKGVMSARTARREKVGGEVLFSIW